MEKKKKRKSIPKPTYFGANLKLLRRMGGMSQKDLSAALDLTRNKISSYESGIVEPNASLFLEVSHYFNVHPKEMLKTVLTDHLIESMRISTPDLDETRDHLLYAVEGFVEKTNEMTKILNGYKARAELDLIQTDKRPHRELNRAFEEILELFSLLIQYNWDIINQMITYEQKDTDNNDS